MGYQQGQEALNTVTDQAFSPDSGHGEALPAPPQEAPDLSCINHGSIWLVYPNTVAGQDWLAAHIAHDGETQWYGSAVLVEPPLLAAIAEGAIADGLAVE
jgi:hypothetical protein